MFVITIEAIVHIEEFELLIIRLFGFDQDFHLGPLGGDELGGFLDDSMEFHRVGLKQKKGGGLNLKNNTTN